MIVDVSEETGIVLDVAPGPDDEHVTISINDRRGKRISILLPLDDAQSFGQIIDRVVWQCMRRRLEQEEGRKYV